MSAFWRWSFLFCVLKCTVLLLGNYVRWVCHKMWFFLWECCTSSWKKALRCQTGFDSIHKTFQQIRFPCRRNCVTAVPSVGRLKRSANKGGTHCHQRRTKLWYHLTSHAPDPFFFFFPPQHSLSLHWRLAHRKDCLDKKLYPLLMHKHRVPTQKCSVCYVFIGRCVKASAQVQVSDCCRKFTS